MDTKTKEISFTQYEKTCEHHDATDNRICYCVRTGKTCNKMSCLKFNGGEENAESR